MALFVRFSRMAPAVAGGEQADGAGVHRRAPLNPVLSGD
jgi:hypothetical protein